MTTEVTDPTQQTSTTQTPETSSGQPNTPDQTQSSQTSEVPPVEKPVEQVPPVEKPDDPVTPPPAQVDEFEEYELELSEGSPLKDEDLDAVIKIAEERGLNAEEAKALLKEREDFVKRGEQNVMAYYDNKFNKNREELLATPEYSPERIEETGRRINRVVDKYGDQGMREFLNSPEGGNNPALSRFILSIEKAMEPDSFQGKGVSQQAPKEKSMGERLYPELYENK